MKKMLLATVLGAVLGSVAQAQTSATQMSTTQTSTTQMSTTQMTMPMNHAHAAMPQAAAQVSGAFVAAQPPTATDTAAFFVLKNTGKKPLVLTGGSSLGAASAMLMRFGKLSNGQTAMQMVDSFTIAPGQSLTLAPGGNHLMLMGLKKPLKVGESLNLKLHFADGSMLNLTAPIKKY